MVSKMSERIKILNLKIDEKELKNIIIKKGEHSIITKKPYKKKNVITEGIFEKLKPKDVDELKKWIGVSDRTAEKSFKDKGIEMLSNKITKDVIQKAKVDSSLIGNVFRAYIYGNSKKYQEVKLVLANFLQQIEVLVGFFNNIEILSGATLEIRPDVHVLEANTIRIHPGGKLLTHSDLTIECNSLIGGP